MVATTDDLDSPVIEPAEEGLQNGPRHGADLVPDDDSRNKLLAHSLRRPIRLTTPAEEAVIGLGLYAPFSHFFGQAMGRSKHEGVSHAEQLNCSCCFATAAAAIQIIQLMAG